MARESGKTDTRERILAASLRLAGREGPSALTTRRVAAEAGVTLGSLHYHFASKEALVEETVGRFLGELSSLLAAAGTAGAEEEPEEVLAAILTEALALGARNPGLIFGLAGELVAAAARSAADGMERPFDPASAPPILVTMAPAQARLALTVRTLLARRLGDEPGLLARRAVQLFCSLFHPLLFTTLPGRIFGLDLGSEEARSAYVRAVVADAFLPPPP